MAILNGHDHRLGAFGRLHLRHLARHFTLVLATLLRFGQRVRDQRRRDTCNEPDSCSEENLVGVHE